METVFESQEDESIMGKYNKVLDHHDARTAIANELAETNRLKRLELQDKIKTKNEEIDWDLSDQA